VLLNPQQLFKVCVLFGVLSQVENACANLTSANPQAIRKRVLTGLFDENLADFVSLVPTVWSRRHHKDLLSTQGKTKDEHSFSAPTLSPTWQMLFSSCVMTLMRFLNNTLNVGCRTHLSACT
jgi:hypothetical protein